MIHLRPWTGMILLFLRKSLRGCAHHGMMNPERSHRWAFWIFTFNKFKVGWDNIKKKLHYMCRKHSYLTNSNCRSSRFCNDCRLWTVCRTADVLDTAPCSPVWGHKCPNGNPISYTSSSQKASPMQVVVALSSTAVSKHQCCLILSSSNLYYCHCKVNSNHSRTWAKRIFNLIKKSVEHCCP